MNKIQAIQILDQAISQLNTTRQNHQALSAALMYLNALPDHEASQDLPKK